MQLSRLWIIVAIIVSLLLTSCESNNEANIVGPYKLERSDVAPYFYYLTGKSVGTAYGELDSTVGKIGWNNEFIIVWQTSSGLRSGWRLIDVKSEMVSGYIPDNEINNKLIQYGVTLMDVDSAWKVLKNSPNKPIKRD